MEMLKAHFGFGAQSFLNALRKVNREPAIHEYRGKVVSRKSRTSTRKDAVSATINLFIEDVDDRYDALASSPASITEKKKTSSRKNVLKTPLAISLAAAKDAIGATISTLVREFDERHDALASPLGYILKEKGIEHELDGRGGAHSDVVEIPFRRRDFLCENNKRK